MSALLLSPGTPRQLLTMLRRRPLPSVVTPGSAQRVSAPCGAGPSGASTSYAAVRSSLPRHAAAAGESPSPASGPSDSTPLSAEEEAEHAKLSQVRKKLEKTVQYFKSLGSLGFWSHFVCTTVSAGILSFSAVAIGKATVSFTFFATAIGMVAAFISVFRSYGYIRLSEMLKRTANEPSKAPRAGVVKYLRNNIWLNVLGMGAAVLGMQATVGALVAKALTTSSVPYY